MKVIIAGGGIAGLATAIGLRRAGHHVNVSSPFTLGTVNTWADSCYVIGRCLNGQPFSAKLEQPSTSARTPPECFLTGA